MEKALEELNKRKAESDARIAEFRNLINKFKSLIDAGKLKVKIQDGRMIVVLSSDVLFASGSRELSSSGKRAIEEVTEILAEIKERKFQVEGHTDSDRYRAFGMTNWELAAFRALNVVHTMIAAGMPEDKISAASYGETKPVAPNNSSENKKLNRRIEIVVVPDLSLLPGFEELEKLKE
jgi:chemotaxis protein MotB